MKSTYQCPDCRLKKMQYLKLFQRWWCSFCQLEIDVEQTIKEWSLYGFGKKKN